MERILGDGLSNFRRVRIILINVSTFYLYHATYIFNDKHHMSYKIILIGYKFRVDTYSSDVQSLIG